MARRGLELLFVLACVAGLLALLRVEPPPLQPPSEASISAFVQNSCEEFVPRMVTISGVSLGMTRAEVERILGPGPHDQWPVGSLSYTETPPVYVSFDEQDRACRIAGAKMEFGKSVLTQDCSREQMESVLGPSDDSQEHRDRCGGGWSLHHYYAHKLAVLVGPGHGAPFVLDDI